MILYLLLVMSKDWPTIKKPVKPGTKTDVYYDEHMKQFVPKVNLKKAKKRNRDKLRVA